MSAGEVGLCLSRCQGLTALPAGLGHASEQAGLMTGCKGLYERKLEAI